MKIHTELTRSELYAALPDGVDAYITPKGSRKRTHGFDVTLYVYEKDELHRRYGNSGGYGRSSDVAATWDEWGLWIEKVYEKDPTAVIPYYEDRFDFMRETARYRDVVRQFNKPTSLAYRTHTAPWLERVTVQS